MRIVLEYCILNVGLLECWVLKIPNGKCRKAEMIKKMRRDSTNRSSGLVFKKKAD